MLYASSRRNVVQVAQEEGVELTKRIEIGEPDEIGADRLRDLAAEGGEDAGASTGASQGFARPKRPGKR